MSVHALPQAQSDDADDPVLVAAAQRGEARAKEGLFRKYGAMVNGMCFRLLGSDEDLDDLVQECFFQMFRSLGRLDKPQAFRAWLAEIVVRTTHNLIRRRRLMLRIGLKGYRPISLDGLVSTDAPPDVAYALTTIYRVIQNLPPRIRVALVLRRVEGRPLGEVARLMGASLASVKRWISAADKVLGLQRDTGRGER